MHTFRDNANREWAVEINTTAIKRVRGLIDLDLLSLIDDGFAGLGALLADPIRLVDTLYALCKPEADRLGISDEDFGRAMWGDAIGAGTDAFLAEFTDFFPDPRVRSALARMLASGRVIRDRVMERLGERIESLDLDSEARRLIGSSGAAPGSSDSTPGPSPSAS